jgi:hypothetical protein
MLTNPFNCPPQVYRSMLERCPTPTHMPVLWAALALGHERVQYVGRPPHSSVDLGDGTPTSWALDGKAHVTVGEMIAAAEVVAYPVAA